MSHKLPLPLLASAALITLTLGAACDDTSKTEPTTAQAQPSQEGSGGSAKADSSPTQTPEKKAQSANRADLVTTFDLVDNRHLAHLTDHGGLVMDLGQGSALKYVQGRWKNPWFEARTEQGAPIAYPGGVGATLRFPLGALAQGKTDGTWSIQARLKPVGEQRCDVFLNAPGQSEQKIGSLALEPDWKTYTITLPAGLQLGQEHTLRFHFSRSRDVAGLGASAAAFDWVRVGKDLPEQAPGRRAEVFSVADRTLTLKAGQQVSWYTTLGKAQRLVAGARGEGTLTLDTDAGAPETIALSGEQLDVDLSKWAGQAVHLTLAGKDGGALTLTEPALATRKAAPIARGKAPKYVVVWLIDTLRADHLKAYNAKSDVQTPNLDAFIAQSALFERAAVQGNSSLPSSASIFSGAYPPAHGVVRESARHKADSTLLGEGLKKAGFTTGLFSSNGYVSEKWGFSRGFDFEYNPIRDGAPSDSEFLWPQAKTWLEAQIKTGGDKPVLLYLNTSDPHVPYDPPAEQLGLYHKGDRVGRISPRGTGELLHDMAKGGITLTKDEIAYMRALYKGEISYNDLWFGKMLADLDALGIRDQTMIIVTSDHGEEFGEYGRFGHGVSANQELVDVPLIVSYSPWTKQGVKIPYAVEVLDLYPTLLDVAGVARDTWAKNVQGESLVPLMLDPSARHPHVSFTYHNDFLRAARIDDLKYQLFQGDKDPLFALSYQPTQYGDYSKPSPNDGADVSTERPIARRQMRDVMAFQVGFDDAWRRAADGSPNNHSATRAATLDTSW